MKKLFLILLGTGLFNALLSQIIWNGPTVSFSKADGADWTLETNQDRITDSVWLTRRDSQALFNIARENSYVRNQSPIGTLWAKGTTADIANLTFDVLDNSIGSIKDAVDEDLVMFLEKENIYIDVKFTSWASGKEGGKGGFSYERSTEGSTSISNHSNINIRFYPNPAREHIILNNRKQHENATLIDITGIVVMKFKLENGENILNIDRLERGTYFLKVQEGSPVKLIKN